MLTRRRFLQTSAVVSLAPLTPCFLTRLTRAAENKADGRVLVVIQLDGGNDGLNTVVPFAEDAYAKARKTLRIEEKNVLKLDGQLGLHPSMKGAADLFESGRLAIVQGVGYPNPNRSHFKSMSIWQHARLDASTHDGNGWLGRVGEATRTMGKGLDSIYLGSDAVPLALCGCRAAPLAMDSAADLELMTDVVIAENSDREVGDVSDYIRRTVDESYVAARRFKESASVAGTRSAAYPNSQLGGHLHLISRMLKMDAETQLYYTSQPGYDTHATQLFTHSQLLSEFSAALKAFLDDLKESRLDDRVVVLAFSEFGRRVEENDSAGTDHGAAGPVFLAGAPVQGGFIGEHPSFADLGDGDLTMRYDFRQVYATLLDNWLRFDASSVLGEEFVRLPIFKDKTLEAT